jgi:hypothetical protein
MEKKKVIAKVLTDGKQKRVTIPKQSETEDWVRGDILKLEKVEVD